MNIGHTLFIPKPNGRFNVLFLKALNPYKLRVKGFFHNIATWECAALKGILFRTSSLVTGINFCNLSRGKGMLFDNFGQRKVKFW